MALSPESSSDLHEMTFEYIMEGFRVEAGRDHSLNVEIRLCKMVSFVA